MKGSLTMVSVGPGYADHITPAAERAIQQADVVVSYDLYLTWIRPWLDGKEIITYPLTEEKARAIAAIENARLGKHVAIISSGDIGVYGMAALVFDELAVKEDFAVSVVPGVTAANACASLLGSPLSHDFMTLSLSDLLCPWDWIEQRARHAAQADLCMVLYNVRSNRRPDGVYKILKLIAEYKGPQTVCGVVRNAYRPEQAISVTTLADLHKTEFDMLTSVVIGNKFTQSKGNWMFTPRGYNQWQEQASGQSSKPADDAIWVFSGTSDGNEIANIIAGTGMPVVVSTATEYGANVASKSCPSARIVFGKTGSLARSKLLNETRAKAIVDATHPYSQAMSQQLIEISDSLKLPYIRFDRPASATKRPGVVGWTDLSDALAKAVELGKKRVFLACGSNLLSRAVLAEFTPNLELFVRITPDADSLSKTLEAGIPAANILAMQGPYSAALNEVLWREKSIDAVISKDSGTAGGYEDKERAATTLGIPLLVIRRPVVSYPRVATTYDEVIEFISTRHPSHE